MRILFFHKTPAPIGGGANQYVLDILPRIEKAGHPVALVHCRDIPSVFRGTGYLFDELKTPRPLGLKAQAQLEAILDDFQPDLVQFHQVDNYHLDFAIQKKVKVLRFVHHHQFYCSGSNMTWKRPLRACREPHGRFCLLRHYAMGCGSPNPVTNLLKFQQVGNFLEALRQSAAVQTLARELAENLIRNGVAKEKVHLLPTPVPPPTGKAPALPGGRRSVLHVGGLMTKKGVWVAIRTLRALPPDCDLILAGGGEDRGLVESHIRNRGLGDRIRVFPRLSPEEWAKIYHQCSLVIMPCLWNEPLGLGALRAMAYGKPVVAFRSGGLPDWLTDGVNGLLIPTEQRRNFPEAVASLLNHPEELARMGKNALGLWQKHHRMESHLDALLTSYQSLLSR